MLRPVFENEFHWEAGVPTIRENLVYAIRTVEAEAYVLISLNSFEAATNCGTLHCTLGLLATTTLFKDQGLHLVWPKGVGAPVPEFPGLEFSTDAWHAKLGEMFGEDAYARLFEARGAGDFDYDLSAVARTDKQLAIGRLMNSENHDGAW